MAFVAYYAATAASTYLSYRSAREQGRAQQQAAEYNAAVTKADTLQKDAEAREQIRRERAQARRFLSAAQARYAGAGVSTSTGSPLEVLGLSAGEFELQAQERSRVARQQYAQGLARAQMFRFEGAQAKSAANNQAYGSLLSGVASLAGGYMRFHPS